MGAQAGVTTMEGQRMNGRHAHGADRALKVKEDSDSVPTEVNSPARAWRVPRPCWLSTSQALLCSLPPKAVWLA